MFIIFVYNYCCTIFYFQKSSNKCHKFLRQSDVERDELLRIKCDNLLQEVSNLNKNSRYKIIEETENVKKITITPKKLNTRSETIKEPVSISHVIVT